MKPKLTLITSESSPIAGAAEASRRAYAQSAAQACAALETFAGAVKQLSVDAAEIASLSALPPGPRERARRLATVLDAETIAFAQLKSARGS